MHVCAGHDGILSLLRAVTLSGVSTYRIVPFAPCSSVSMSRDYVEGLLDSASLEDTAVNVTSPEGQATACGIDGSEVSRCHTPPRTMCQFCPQMFVPTVRAGERIFLTFQGEHHDRGTLLTWNGIIPSEEQYASAKLLIQHLETHDSSRDLMTATCHP